MWDREPVGEAAAREEGARYKFTYFKDAQYVFSRVQHHVHKKTKQGYVPLSACRKKKEKMKCKADFPKDRLMNSRMRLICKGNAMKFGLRVSGRRNSFGSILGKRTCRWQSGTTPGFASVFRSNTHTQPNYRLPLLPETHDNELCSQQCLKAGPRNLKVTSKLAQRAQREATGYYCGYTSKRQPAGQFELKATAQCLDYVGSGLADKRVGQQWHRITQRTLSDLQHKCALRPATEEVNLSANLHEQDVTNAEFLRTFRSAVLPGAAYIKALEQEEARQEDRYFMKVLPVRKADVGANRILVQPQAELYGYRGPDPRVHYLSPWEFIMFWEVESLRPPASSGHVSKTRWTSDPPTEEMKRERRPGKDYVVADDVAADSDYVVFPDLPVLETFRHEWILRRCFRPMVPSVEGVRMPDRQSEKEGRSRLYSLYLRPWTLAPQHASTHVPHLRDLGRVPHDLPPMPKRRRLTQKREDPGAEARSYEAAWRWYIRGNIVSRHAQRIITQFLAASCSKSTSEDPRQQEEAQVRGENLHAMNSDVSLTRVHNVLSQIVARAHASEKAAADGEANADERLLKFSAQIQTAVRVGSELWGMEKMQWPETALDCRGSMLLRTESAIVRRRVSAPIVSARKVKHAYINLRTADVEGWFVRLQTDVVAK